MKTLRKITIKCICFEPISRSNVINLLILCKIQNSLLYSLIVKAYRFRYDDVIFEKMKKNTQQELCANENRRLVSVQSVSQTSLVFIK